MRSSLLLLLAPLLCSSCEPCYLPPPDEAIPCRASLGGLPVFLEPGDSVTGPQCDDELVLWMTLVLTDDEGSIFECYCLPEGWRPL